MNFVLMPSKKLLISIIFRYRLAIAETDLQELLVIYLAFAVTGRRESNTMLLDIKRRPRPAMNARKEMTACFLFTKNKHAVRIRQNPAESILINGSSASEAQKIINLSLPKAQRATQQRKNKEAVSIPEELIFSKAGLAVAASKTIANDEARLIFKKKRLFLIASNSIQPPTNVRLIFFRQITGIVNSLKTTRIKATSKP